MACKKLLIVVRLACYRRYSLSDLGTSQILLTIRSFSSVLAMCVDTVVKLNFFSSA
jgi:hypothetical protein